MKIFWRIRIPFLTVIALLLGLGFGKNYVLCQSSEVFLDINHNRSGSIYKISVIKIALPNNSYQIKIKKTGFVANNELIQWTIQYSDLNGKIQNQKIKLEYKKGSESTEQIEKINNAKAIRNICVESNISPKIIKLPEASEFTPKIDNKDDFILEGESITLDMVEISPNQNLSWYWINKINGEIIPGKRIQIKANNNCTFEVFAKYNNTNFRTVSKNLNIQVKKAFEIVDYSIIGPIQIIDDTIDLNLSLKINRNLIGESLRWEWYKESDNFSNAISESSELKVKATPIHRDTVFKVCPTYGARNFGCKKIDIKLNHLQDPDKFELKEPIKKFSDSSVIITTKIRTSKPAIWTWTLNGKVLPDKGDSIKIERPINGMQICGFPTLNKRGGKQMEKCITLSNVILKTKLPTKISGLFERCYADYAKEAYTLIDAKLGSEDKFWRLIENGKEIRRFTGDTLKLLPLITTKYRITAENNFDKYFEFEIIVNKPPVLSGGIEGNGLVCPGKQFSLNVSDFKGSENATLNWYKTDAGNKTRNFIGTGMQISDAISANSSYEIEAINKGCSSDRKLYKTVTIINVPSMPVLGTPVIKGSSSQKADVFIITTLNDKTVYEWSMDNFNTVMSRGSSIKGLKLNKGTNKVYARAINECGTGSRIAKQSLVRSKSGYFFMNVGLVSTDLENLETVMLSMGGRKVFIRVKLNTAILGNESNYSTTYSDRKLEINNNGRVVNFPPSTGNYYIVNDQMANNRQSATIVTTFGGKILRFYVGGGYGVRTNLWGLNLNSYASNQNTGKVWAKNIDQSWQGIEGEAGLFFKLGNFNIMGGASAIFDSKQSSPFIDFHLGIGFSTR